MYCGVVSWWCGDFLLLLIVYFFRPAVCGELGRFVYFILGQCFGKLCNFILALTEYIIVYYMFLRLYLLSF